MLQSALLDCPFLDLFPFSENGFVTPEVDVGECDVVDALVVALMIVVIEQRRRVHQADHFEGAGSRQRHTAARVQARVA